MVPKLSGTQLMWRTQIMYNCTYPDIAFLLSWSCFVHELAAFLSVGRFSLVSRIAGMISTLVCRPKNN